MSGPSNVLALVTDAFGERGGMAQYNRDFISAVAANGTGVLVVPRKGPNRVRAPSRVRQWKARSGRVVYSLAVLRAALTRKTDIVFCGHVYMAPLARIVSSLAGAKLVMQMHGIEAWPKPSPLVRKAVESSDLVLCVSRYTRARVLDWASIPPERVVVIPNTVSEIFSPGADKTLRREWGLEGKRVLLTVGRLDEREPYKGQDRIILLLRRLLALGHDVVYVVAGEGDDRARLEALAKEKGLQKRVKFVGALPTDRLVRAYRIADLFVMPSSGEGFGIAFLEAMACGTPALGLAQAGAVDALADGELGTIADEKTIVSAIDEILDSKKCEDRALAARTRARFGRTAFQTRIKDVLATIA